MTPDQLADKKTAKAIKEVMRTMPAGTVKDKYTQSGFANKTKTEDLKKAAETWKRELSISNEVQGSAREPGREESVIDSQRQNKAEVPATAVLKPADRTDQENAKRVSDSSPVIRGTVSKPEYKTALGSLTTLSGDTNTQQGKALTTITTDLKLTETVQVDDGNGGTKDVIRTYVPDAAFLKQSLGTKGYANLVGAGKAFENDAALDAAINAKLNPPTNP